MGHKREWGGLSTLNLLTPTGSSLCPDFVWGIHASFHSRVLAWGGLPPGTPVVIMTGVGAPGMEWLRPEMLFRIGVGRVGETWVPRRHLFVFFFITGSNLQKHR